VPSYLVESYLADSPAAAADAEARARLAAELDDGVRYVRTTFLPADELVMHVFEAASADAVRCAAGRAGLPYERVVEAVEGGTEADGALTSTARDPGARPGRSASIGARGAGAE
jgi:hypothetical protein